MFLLVMFLPTRRMFTSVWRIKFLLTAGHLACWEEYGCAFKKVGLGSSKVSIRINPGEGSGHSKKTNTGGPYSKHGIWYET